MTEDDLKAVLAKYQHKSFELFNQNIVLETQVEKLNTVVTELKMELEKLKKSKRTSRAEEDFQ